MLFKKKLINKHRILLLTTSKRTHKKTHKIIHKKIHTNKTHKRTHKIKHKNKIFKMARTLPRKGLTPQRRVLKALFHMANKIS